MNNKEIKERAGGRIISVSMVILPTLLLLWVVVDLLFFSLVPWQYAGFNDYLLLKENIFWKQYTDHCRFFEPKLLTSLVWHISWAFSLLGLMFLTKLEQKSTERYHNTPPSLETGKIFPEKGKLSRDVFQKYTINTQLVLITVGAVVLRIKGTMMIFLLILVPLSFLPQFFLSKMISRRSFQKLKKKSDYVIIPVLMLCLLVSTLLFGRVIACG